MQLILRQIFPLGRFHATPWKASPFDDPHGEWPPSPWRLLRGVIARSYQLEREAPPLTREQREELVTAFCQSAFSWRLPEFTWRGPGLRQYQPVEFGWNHPKPRKLDLVPLQGKLRDMLGGRFAIIEKNHEKPFMFEVFDENKKHSGHFQTDDAEIAKSFREASREAESRGAILELKRYFPAGRGYSTTKIQDNFRLIGGSDPAAAILWFLSGELWEPPLVELLDACLARMTYFGRAESITEIRLVREPSIDLPPANCHPSEERRAGMGPVLAPSRGANLQQIEASTDDKLVANSTTPPGARWLYSKFPRRPAFVRSAVQVVKHEPKQLIQFAIGARVLPAPKDLVCLTQRFRGRVLRSYLNLVTDGTAAQWGEAPEKLRERAGQFTGKDSSGHPLPHHCHPTFFVNLENGKPVRLCVWRSEAFDDDEQTAILLAAEAPLPLGFKGDPWTVTLIPLDSLVPPPPALSKSAHATWETLTPFVPPRHVFDRRGRTKPHETVEEQVRHELENRGIDSENVGISIKPAGWVKVHQPRPLNGVAKNIEKLGYQVRVSFSMPRHGPLFLGASSHFGLGVFVPVNGPDEPTNKDWTKD